MMDQSEDHKLYTADKFLKRRQWHKRTLLLVFSVSVFSLLLSYSSGFSCFLHSFNLYYSSYLFSFITHGLERKYMFIICNGIVAFLAGYPAFSSSALPGSGIDGQFLKRIGDGGISASELSDMKLLVVPMGATVEGIVGSLGHDHLVVEDHNQREENEPHHLEEQERENQALIVEDREAGEETGSSIPEAAEEEDEELTSTEDLNKKFEDFIRRMKEELRVEAQSQLIAV